LLQVKILEVAPGLDADPAGLEHLASTVMPLEEEQLLPEAPVGVDSQKALAKHHECSDLHNAVGSEVM
jgi:hypothetical protein